MIPLRHLGRVLATIVLLGLPTAIAAQDNDGVSFDFGAPPERPATTGTIPDSLLRQALDRFNDPATLRSYGGTQVNAPVAGTIGVYDGDARSASRVDGDVVVINGSLRLDSTAVVAGRIIVLGGLFLADPGARFESPVSTWPSRVAV